KNKFQKTNSSRSLGTKKNSIENSSNGLHRNLPIKTDGSLRYPDPKLSEFPGPDVRPPFYDYLGLCKKFDGVLALAVQVPKEAIFPSTKRKLGHRRGHTYVYPYVPGICLVSKPSGIGTT